jgi:hypothetical protein
MVGYIDYYYCFNYVDVEKEMNRDADNDLGLNTSAMSEQTNSDDISRLVPLRLSNEESANSSSNFIQSYTAVNESTKKSLQNGYATITKTYDRLKKQFLVFKVDSTTSDGEKSHILKGDQFDDKYQNENIKHKFLGKIDTDNVHKNYNYAVTQNRINLNNLNKIALVNVILPNANWNLYKFMKINVDLFSPAASVANPNIRDFRYSGYYIIADIEYIWNGKKMSQKLRLIKKELGKNIEEVQNSPPQKKKPEVKESNENPVGLTPSTPVPNSVYSVGTSYLVQDRNGKTYNLKVTSLLENGIEVTGTLTDSIIGSNPSLAGLGQFASVPGAPLQLTNEVVGSSASVSSETPFLAPPSEPEYIIEVAYTLKPGDQNYDATQIEKLSKITGTIKIKKTGPFKQAEGTLLGLPPAKVGENAFNGGLVPNPTGATGPNGELIDLILDLSTWNSTIGPLQSEKLATLPEATFVSQMIDRLKQEIINKYYIDPNKFMSFTTKLK